MKNILYFFLFLVPTPMVFAQGVAVNNSGAAADPSAILDLSSNAKGVLVPRMTTTEREAIPNPAQGLLVYDITSRSFWVNDGGWEEIAAAGGPGGAAGGDLSGNYPSPNVVKIQNLDVAFGVPFDKQVLKWDALANNWKGRNDSLFLPYNVSFGSPTKLFGITNNNTTGGATAIFGRTGNVGSGVNPGFTMGVWGDNAMGQGVVGTSSEGWGVYGSSIYNHGVAGFSGSSDKAGIYGSSTEGGVGVLGEIEESFGVAVMGSHLASTGKAGVFKTTSVSHNDTTWMATTAGQGWLSILNVSNTGNNKPALEIKHAGIGQGMKLLQTNAGNGNHTISATTQGTGAAFYGRSQNGSGAVLENINATNTLPLLQLTTNSTGNAISINTTNTGSGEEAVDIQYAGTNTGLNIQTPKGKAATFTVSDPTATNPIMHVQQHGTGKGIYIYSHNANSTLPALDLVSNGTKGVWSQTLANNSIGVYGATGATANNAVGVKGVTAPNAQNGIGVLGQAGVNDSNGIGVKGIAGGDNDGGIGVLGETSPNTPMAIAVKGIGYSHNEDVGAVTGINMVDGVGVFGEALGYDGIAVAGTVGNTGNHSVAGVFTNTYTENNRAVVEVITNGQGNGILIDHNHLTTTSPLLRMTNSGNGQFLRLESGLGDIKTTLDKQGNLVTDGTVKVKNEFGIVRNTFGEQLRVEIMTCNTPAGFVAHYDEFNAWDDYQYEFETPFSSPPAVYLAGFVSGSFLGLTPLVGDITNTGFELSIANYTPYDFNYVATTFNVVVIGVMNE